MKRSTSLHWDDLLGADISKDGREDQNLPSGVDGLKEKAGGSANDPELTGSDNAIRVPGENNDYTPPPNDDDGSPPSVTRSARLKRCVTFGSMPKNRVGNSTRGNEDHMRLREMDNVEPALPSENASRMRRVNSSQILRQAFPTTIFDSVQGVENNVDEASGSLSDSMASMRAMLDDAGGTPPPPATPGAPEFEFGRAGNANYLGGEESTGGWYDYRAKTWQSNSSAMNEPVGLDHASSAPAYSPPQFPGVAPGLMNQPPPGSQMPQMPYGMPMPPYLLPNGAQGPAAAQMPPALQPQPTSSSAAGPLQMTAQQQQQQQAYFFQMYTAHMQAWAAAAAQAGAPRGMPASYPMPPAPMSAPMQGRGGGSFPPPNQHAQGYQRPNRQHNSGGRDHNNGGRDHNSGGRGGGRGSGGRFQPRGHSGLLQEYKSSGRRVEMGELVGHVNEFACDSHGSRFLQFKCESASDEEKAVLFEEVLPVAVELGKDIFGNYVIQCMLSNGTEDQTRELIKCLRGNLLDLSFSVHGCRVTQRALQVAAPEQRRQLIAELLPHVGRCARNSHATHCIQRIVALVDSEERALLERAVDAELLELAIHPQASRLVQRILASQSDRPLLDQMRTTLKNNFDFLSLDQHGNFILQNMLVSGSADDAQAVQDYVLENASRFASHKFASHLVERCLSEGSPPQCQALLRRILGGLLDDEPHLDDSTLKLIRDPYGNFCVQRAYDVTYGAQRQALNRAILRHAELLSRFTYGRHILSHTQSKMASRRVDE